MDFYLLQKAQTGSGAHPASCSVVTELDLHLVRRLRMRNYTSTPPIYLNGLERDNYIFKIFFSLFHIRYSWSEETRGLQFRYSGDNCEACCCHLWIWSIKYCRAVTDVYVKEICKSRSKSNFDDSTTAYKLWGSEVVFEEGLLHLSTFLRTSVFFCSPFVQSKPTQSACH
jgi:hypothetical protein